jgi:uncharacterized iron-regulated protein
MVIRLSTFMALLALAPSLSAQDVTEPVPSLPEDHFSVYRADGTDASLDDVLDALAGADVLLVGEEHGNPVGHRLEEALLDGAVERVRGTARWVTLSLEMFERDVQYVVDEYLSGLITEEHFLDSARPWPDYENRYRPLVELAREEGLPVVASNAPRRYVNRVTREGPGALDVLGPLARFYLPPLPYPGPSTEYRAQWDEVMAEAMAAAGEHGDTSNARGYAGSENALQAQALWDAAMGHAIAGALDVAHGALVVHFAGSFHVERGTGIAERIEDYRPGTQVVSVVMTQVGEDVGAWDEAAHRDLADFVILTR